MALKKKTKKTPPKSQPTSSSEPEKNLLPPTPAESQSNTDPVPRVLEVDLVAADQVGQLAMRAWVSALGLDLAPAYLVGAAQYVLAGDRADHVFRFASKGGSYADLLHWEKAAVRAYVSAVEVELKRQGFLTHVR